MPWLTENKDVLKEGYVYSKKMRIPETLLSEHSIVLTKKDIKKIKKFPVHIVLLWNNTENNIEKRYYCGKLHGPPISHLLLRDFEKKESKVEKFEMEYFQISSLILKRFQHQKTLKCQSLTQEWLARWIIYNIISNPLQWLKKEEERIIMLLDEYDIKNIQLIYPEIKSKETAVEDVKRTYNEYPCVINIPDDISDKLLGWVDEYFN